MTEVIRLDGINVKFEQNAGLLNLLSGAQKKYIHAVNGVDLSVNKGEIVSLVGESGSGKTTLGRASLMLLPSNALSGTVRFEGSDITKKHGAELKDFRQKAQMIFQDPYQSLNPKNTIYKIVAEPLEVNGLNPGEGERADCVTEALERAGLRPAADYMKRYPHELSGGQRQRVAIAGALVLNPSYIVADEPVSMLDVSIRSGILRLISQMREELGISYLFITHDLSLAWMLSDRIAIMYLGKILELGSADEIIKHPLNPYSRALIDVMPVLAARKGSARRPVLRGDAPNPAVLPKGCVFSHKCPMKSKQCNETPPVLREMEQGHFAACHYIE